MEIVFLDANILFSASYTSNSALTRLWKARGTSLVSSWYTVEEAERNLDNEMRRNRLKYLLSKMRIIEDVFTLSFPSGIELPQKDKPILLGAIAAHATYLLTGDFTHFGKYYGKTFGGVTILPPSLFFDCGIVGDVRKLILKSSSLRQRDQWRLF